MCAQISCLTHLTQLYFTDKAASTEVCLWAYAMCRATEAEMRKATGEESRAMYEHLLLRHAPSAASRGDSQAPVEAPDGQVTASETDEALAFLLGEREQRWRVEALVQAGSQPVFVLQQLTAMLRVAFDRGTITNIRALIALHASVEKMQLAHSVCQRVQLAPEPYSYTSLMKTSSVIWCGAIPFVLMPTLQIATIPMCGMLSFFVSKIDEISAELQNPFGYDISDIGMGAINGRLQREVAQSVLIYNHYDASPLPWTVSGAGNAMDAAADSKVAGAVKLGLPTRSCGRRRGSAAARLSTVGLGGRVREGPLINAKSFLARRGRWFSCFSLTLILRAATVSSALSHPPPYRASRFLSPHAQTHTHTQTMASIWPSEPARICVALRLRLRAGAT